jgi:2-dehydro-3-deoxy-D-arabinonate dehydratase
VKLLRTSRGVMVEDGGAYADLNLDWDHVIALDDLEAYLADALTRGRTLPEPPADLLAPVSGQEVWAAGVTYLRSRAARVQESSPGSGGSFYDRVYDAERPELFFKAPGWRVRGPGEEIRVRRDARWSVPEPELAAYVDPRGRILGWVVANDVSSRDIEGENPLYLPQAKTYDGACALGPAVLVRRDPLPPETQVSVVVRRDGASVFQGETDLSRMHRTPQDLVGWLYRETSFPSGCVLLTGTGIVPPDDFTLGPGDVVEIRIPPIGTLVNAVAAHPGIPAPSRQRGKVHGRVGKR